MKALQILVVEDDSLIAMLLVETLAEMGHGVCGVETTEGGAVTAALRSQPDLIIVDAQLRQGNGVSAVDQILVAGFVPHLFISGDIRGIQAQRPDAVAIEKPFRDTELEHAIRRAIEAAELRHEDRAARLSNK